jgi:hypothetical protein
VKRDVQLLLLAVSSGFVMRVCAPSVLCAIQQYDVSSSRQSKLPMHIRHPPAPRYICMIGWLPNRHELNTTQWQIGIQQHLGEPRASAAAALLLCVGRRHDIHRLNGARAVGAAAAHMVLRYQINQINSSIQMKSDSRSLLMWWMRVSLGRP